MSFDPVSNHFFSQRMSLHYVDWGNHGAPILLLVHGGHDHCRSWDWTARAFRDHWHVIAVDLSGHGDSDWLPDGNYSISSYTYDLAQLVDHLDENQVHIVGHSLGGAIVSRYAGLYPDRVAKLVAIEGLRPLRDDLEAQDRLPFEQRMRNWIDKRKKSLEFQPKKFVSIESARVRLHKANPHLNDEQALHLTKHALLSNKDGTYSWKFDPCLAARSPIEITDDELHALWRNCSMPTLLMCGTDSWASNPEKDGRLGFFPDARVIEYADAGHWLHHDQFEKFIADLRTFLE